jgi:hypothetical protein
VGDLPCNLGRFDGIREGGWLRGVEGVSGRVVVVWFVVGLGCLRLQDSLSLVGREFGNKWGGVPLSTAPPLFENPELAYWIAYTMISVW